MMRNENDNMMRRPDEQDATFRLKFNHLKVPDDAKQRLVVRAGDKVIYDSDEPATEKTDDGDSETSG